MLQLRRMALQLLAWRKEELELGSNVGNWHDML